ncbi:hypothetical protein DAPPUDRAFT_319222 [Daphnia pulex]|uniref:Uncharacterized protein n=1 Tax=Daphnia pulex TaxID=6669 RepID=E9GL23_DAPPU|nr:hypothetical protein DAPPUDRAFT_319222 [Daphnia pulex]|eukprot:EFX79867.1 hypothetical protein DAPPUDRAFT_319222 [Daphnia pulex]
MKFVVVLASLSLALTAAVEVNVKPKTESNVEVSDQDLAEVNGTDVVISVDIVILAWTSVCRGDATGTRSQHRSCRKLLTRRQSSSVAATTVNILAIGVVVAQ